MSRPLAPLGVFFAALALSCRAPCPPPEAPGTAAPLASSFSPLDEPAPQASAAPQSPPSSAPPQAPPDPQAPPPLNQGLIAQDFGHDLYSDESFEVSYKLALGMSREKPSSRSGAWAWPRGDCGGFRVEARGDGSMALSDASGKVKATFARKKGSIGWSSDVTCGDITGDGRPELIASTFTERAEALIVSLVDPPKVIYEGEAPYLEKGEDGRFALHLRDPILSTLGLPLPRLITPPLPRYLVLDRGRFVDRTRDEKKRVEAQRALALAASTRGGEGPGCPEADVFCREQLAAFFAGTAWLLGDDPFDRLPHRADRDRARAILEALRSKEKGR